MCNVHVYGIPDEDVVLCKLLKDRQLLDQLIQATKKHLQCDQHSKSFFLFMHKGKIIDQSENSTGLKIKSKDQILAISPWFYNCLDVTLDDVEDLDRLHVKVLVISKDRKIHRIMTRLNTAKYLKQQFD